MASLKAVTFWDAQYHKILYIILLSMCFFNMGDKSAIRRFLLHSPLAIIICYWKEQQFYFLDMIYNIYTVMSK